jgi:hypothetical protein
MPPKKIHPPLLIPYCGSKSVPTGRRKGTTSECFKSGITVGFKAGVQKGLEQGRQRSQLMGQIKSRSKPKVDVDIQGARQRMSNLIEQERRKFAEAINAPPRVRTSSTIGTQTERQQQPTYEQGIKEQSKRGKVLRELAVKSKHKEIMDKINSSGLTALKNDIHLDNLSKDEIRAICTRYTGTPNAVPRYWTLKLPELKDALVDRGWKL